MGKSELKETDDMSVGMDQKMDGCENEWTGKSDRVSERVWKTDHEMDKGKSGLFGKSGWGNAIEWVFLLVC